jgi:hypothetical protein
MHSGSTGQFFAPCWTQICELEFSKMKIAEALQMPARDAEIWPLSVEAYHALGEAGLIPKRTELLYGFVYHKMAKSPLRKGVNPWVDPFSD